MVSAVAHRVPQLLGDEGHERVQHHQDLIERPGGDALGLVVRRGGRMMGHDGRHDQQESHGQHRCH